MPGLVVLHSESDCAAWAQSWAACLEGWIQATGWGPRIFLEGELGVGKTTFIRHLLRALGVQERVKSPSFGLLNSYPLACGVQAHHFDFYRLVHPRDWLGCGLESCFEGPDIVLAEWPQRAWLPAPDCYLEWRLATPECDPHHVLLRQVAVKVGPRIVEEDLRCFDPLFGGFAFGPLEPWKNAGS